MSQVETVEEFLARGGKIDTLPRGAMAEAGWTPSQMIRVAATGNTGQGDIKAPTPPESVPVTGVHRVSRGTDAQAPVPRSPPAVTAARATPRTLSPAPPKAPRNNGRDGAKTRALIAALTPGWHHVSDLAKATGQVVGHCSARLTQLRHAGLVISHGQRPRMLWAAPGTELPDATVAPPREFDGITDGQLRSKAEALRNQVREAQRLTVRIERELKQRRRANQRAAL